MQKLKSLKSLLHPARYLITGALLAYLIWQADPLLIWQKVQSLNVRWLLLALVLQLVGVALSSFKWGVILGKHNQQQPFGWLVNTYLVGQFANNFLPTGVGGDAVRVVQLGRRIGSFSQSSASVFIDRLTGFLALSLIANVALVLSFTGLAGFQLTASNPADHQFLNDKIIYVITIGFTLMGIVVVAGCFAAPWIHGHLGKYLPEFIDQPVERIARSLADYFPQGRALIGVLGLSLAFQSLWVVINYTCGLALGIDAPIIIYALIAPIADILGLLPIFVNNIGARELVFTFFLFYVGVPRATSLVLAFIVLTVRLLVSLIGGVVVLSGGADLRLARQVSQPEPLSGES